MMVPTQELALALRFGEHRAPNAPPDVAAFGRSPAPSAQAARTGPMEGLAVVPGARPLLPSAPLVLFFRQAGYGIPQPRPSAEPVRPDLSSWSMKPTVFGYLAHVPAERPAASGRARAAWVVAACLPLMALSPVAVAAPGDDGPTVQRPVPVVPELPGSSSDADDEAVATPEPGVEPTPGVQPPSEPEPETDPPSTLAPPPPAPTPDFSVAPGASEQALLDAAWEGVDGFEVELQLKGGRELRGHVGAVQRDTFTLIEAGTGAVLVLPKSGVVTLRVYVPPEVPTQNGTGLLVGGGLLTGVGTPVFVAGVSILGLCPSCVSVNLPLLLVGGAALGAGIPMLVRGTQRRQAYQRALNERMLSPMVSRTRHGWTGGLRFRF